MVKVNQSTLTDIQEEIRGASRRNMKDTTRRKLSDIATHEEIILKEDIPK